MRREAIKFKIRDVDRLSQDGTMTYQKIFNLKFKELVPTYQLGKRYPKERKKISRVALLELPLSTLRELVKRERELRKLISLKQWFLEKEGKKKRVSCFS